MDTGWLNMKRALIFGILGSFFFAFTFVLNRSMSLSGGNWLWSASLRYLFTLPLLFVLLAKGRKYSAVVADIKKHPAQWILWSTVGFGMFYVPLSMASAYAESWFIAAAWQFTIIAGILLTPVFGEKLPVKNLAFAAIILVGIAVMQLPQIPAGEMRYVGLSLALIMVSAFSYPLGNRKMMEVCEGRFSAIQRVFGMTLSSFPFWVLCAGVALARSGVPSAGQVCQSLLVALLSGVFATVLFFAATDIVRENPRQLAVIEATQAGEVVFTLLLGILFLRDGVPGTLSCIGLMLVVAGMVASSISSGFNDKGERSMDYIR